MPKQHRPYRLTFLIVACVASWTPPNLYADETFYLEKIKPIFKERCYACHGALKQESGLRLDSGALIREGGDSGEVVDIKSVADSILLERVTASGDERMPPEGMPLEPQQIEAIRRWIESGAASPADEQAEADPSKHWAFQPIHRPQLPNVANTDWPRGAIDRFVIARHEKLGLKTAGDASAAHQLRRLYLDLIGLPPTAKQLNEFLADPSDAHYERIARRLLDSPQYGERWGRHWMDVWRYSDWYGRRQQNDVRNSAPQIWRWRDWIIQSLNDDKGYDRMVMEMLAADELFANDDSTWPATGYLVRNYFSLNTNEWMRDNVEYTGKAFLGLTFNCAHCHDHKYDPIKHEDYFRLRAFFEPIGVRQDRVLGEPEPPPFQPYTYAGSRKVVNLGMVRIFDENPDAETWFYTGGDERNRDKDRGGVQPGVPEFLGQWFPEVKPIQLPTTGWYPGARRHIQKQMREELNAALDDAQAKLEKARTEKVDTTAADQKLADAQQAFEAARAKAEAEKQPGALSGKQSLLIQANSARRILQNDLAGLKTVPIGAEFRFTVRMISEGNFNFQLARDTSKHLTALYIGFVNGQVRAYHPGGFKEFTAAKYDVAAKVKTFNVRLVLDPAKDQGLLTITAPGVDKPLCQDTPIALNGWNPTKNKHQPITFDCRSGTTAILDDVSFTAGEQSFQWDFEAPTFKDGKDAAGVLGWRLHEVSAAPATSVVSMIAANDQLRAAYDAWRTAEMAREWLRHGLVTALARVSAANSALMAFEATIDADEAAALGLTEAAVNEAKRTARNEQRDSALDGAHKDIIVARVELASAELLPDADAAKKKKVEDCRKKHTAAKKHLEAVKAKWAKGKPEDYERLSPVTSKSSTGRRAALARWIADRRNPLTARVAVNHIWMRHFGSPIVDSVDNFGRNGSEPTHPQLLDWLAAELMDHDWSMKHLHRLIVTSSTYRMTSSLHGLENNMSIDKDNRLLWRRRRLRMEAEAVRDSILAIAGKLDTKVGGPVLINKNADKSNRRSLYYEVYPEDGGAMPIARLFDAPDPGECFRRTQTIVPQQALALSNSNLIHAGSKQAAAAIAAGLNDDARHDGDFVDRAFRSVLSRPANDQERSASLLFFTQQRARKTPAAAARESFVRVLFNHNDFVTIR